MFVVTEDVLRPKDVGNDYPPLVIADYPETTLRLLALAAYYSCWGVDRSPPFIDSRMLHLIRGEYRLQFIQFSNLYYYSSMQKLQGSISRPAVLVNRLDICYNCRMLGKCKQICLVGLNNLPRPHVDAVVMDRIARAVSSEDYSNEDVTLRWPRSLCHPPSVLSLFDNIVKIEAKVIKPDETVPVNNVPEDQEEWWME